MPSTLIGYTASQDSAVLLALAAMADQSVRVNGNDIIVPSGMNSLIGAYGVGVNITRLQLQAPSLRRFLNPEIAPLDISAEPTSPTPFYDLRSNPITLDPQEALDALAAENGAGATRQSAFVWLGDGPITPVSGDIRTVRVTGTTTLIAFTWSNGALTFDQTLPAGRYQIVGGRFEAAGLLAWRCVFPGGGWRPGAIGYDASSDVEHPAFRMGGLGVWGEFEHNAPPTIDWCSVSADTSELGELDLIKVA